MKVNLPRSECPQMKLTTRTTGWSNKTYVKPPYGVCELVIPPEIDIRGVEITAEGCDLAGNAIERLVFLRRAVQVPPGVPVSQPVQVKAEPAKPKRKRVKRGHEIAPSVESADLDNTRSQVNVVDDERDVG